jgi:hypothetical protein
MTFDIFLKKPMPEAELLEQITSHLQKNYSAYQVHYFFIKLEIASDQLIQAVWIKTFTDVYEWGDFFYDTKFKRSCILIKFEKQQYELLVHGVYISDKFKIWPDRTEGSRPRTITWSRENDLMPSRELIERGFGGISGQIVRSKRNIAV